MKIKSNLVNATCVVLLTLPTFAQAAPNPASQDWVMQQISLVVANLPKGEPIPGTYTSHSWIAACPSGAAGLLSGCSTNGTAVGASPISALVNPLWSAVNTTPNSTANSVYIKKFPPGYIFTANAGRSITYDATGIPTTSKAWCVTDPISEAGVDLDCQIINDPTQGNNSGCIYNVSFSGSAVTFGTTRTFTVLDSSPGGSALPLGIPIYVVCIGINNTTGAPASIAGFTAS